MEVWASKATSRTLLKFNASFLASRNDTESFIQHKLTEEEDQLHLMRMARKRDESGHQKALKVTQIRADEEKILENRRKETQRGEKRQKQVNDLLEAVMHLALTDSKIDNLKSEALILQLECHREIEKQRLTVDSGNGNSETAAKAGKRMPLKSHMKNKAQRIPELRKAMARFHARGETKEEHMNYLMGYWKLISRVGKITYMSWIMMICSLDFYIHTLHTYIRKVLLYCFGLDEKRDLAVLWWLCGD